MVDRTLHDFLNHHWFRVEVEGIDNAPWTVARRSSATTGALRPDGIMITKALREEYPRTRLCRVAVFVNASTTNPLTSSLSPDETQQFPSAR